MKLLLLRDLKMSTQLMLNTVKPMAMARKVMSLSKLDWLIVLYWLEDKDQDLVLIIQKACTTLNYHPAALYLSSTVRDFSN
jgi:hypothetical protein